MPKGFQGQKGLQFDDKARFEANTYLSGEIRKLQPRCNREPTGQFTPYASGFWETSRHNER